MQTEDLLRERGKTHGNYSDHAAVTQKLKNVIRDFHKLGVASDTPIPSWDYLTVCQKESLDMIVHKIGRILAGDPDFRDHWDDIAGYAKLVAERCTK